MNKWKALILGDGRNQARKNVVWNMIGSILFALASILLFAVATRATGEYYGGIFSIAFTTGQLLLTISYYEVRPFQVTDVSKKYGFQEYLSVRVITSAVMAVAGIIYVLVTGPVLVKAVVILLMCFYKMMDGVADVFEGEFHRQGRLDIAGKSLAFRTAFSGGIFILVVILSKDIVVASVAAVIAAVAAFVAFDLVIVGEIDELRLSVDWKKIFGLLKDCFFLFLGSFLYLYICNAAKYAIDANMTEEAVTFYTDIYLPTSVVNLLSGFIFKPLLTTMGEHYEAKEWKPFRAMVAKMLGGIVLLTAVCCLGAFLLGVPVLSWFFGQNLAPYKGALVILICGGGFNAAAMLLYYALTTMRRQRQIIICYVLAFLIALICTPFVVKQLGILGGALCYTGVMGTLVVFFFITALVQYKKASKESAEKVPDMQAEG